MKSVCIALATTAISVAYAQERQYRWTNQKLIDSGITPDQYQSIGRGDMAHCDREAKSTAQAVVQMPNCSQIMSSPDFSLWQQCSDSNLQTLRQKSQQVYRDLMTGCMASRNWFWLKLN